MTATIDTTADRALKAKHRTMRGLGDYPRFYRGPDETVMEWESLIVTARKRR